MRAALMDRADQRRRSLGLRATVTRGLVAVLFLLVLAVAQADGEYTEASAVPEMPEHVSGTEPIEQPDDTLAVRATGLNAPTLVMLRSVLVPGWGQAKNGAWIKAVLFAGMGAALYERVYFENRMVREYAQKAQDAHGDESLVNHYEKKVARHENHRRDFIWWTCIFLGFCGGDAYVDAHLKGFDVRIQVEPDYEGSPQGGLLESLTLRASLSLPVACF
jgi:hypothetical protein